MKFLKSFAPSRFLILQILIATLCFLVCSSLNYEIIDPRNFSWFLKPTITNDIQTHWISWEFFRHTEFFQFPFLINPQYGAGLNLSIFHTDSIPLMAFLLRMFDQFLPSDFQYFGIWTLLSFFLMIHFSTKLMNIFVQNKTLSLIFSIFFTISPLFITRVFTQQAVSSHWLIVAALYLYYKDSPRYLPWGVLLVISLLINGYVAAMVFAIFFAFTVRQYMVNKNYNLSHIYKLLFIFSIILLSAYIFGLFSIGKGIKEGGFDIYGSSLLAFINPLSPVGFQSSTNIVSTHSIIMEVITSSYINFGSWRQEMKEVEGFAFLGTAALLSILIILFNFKKPTKLFKTKNIHAPVLIIGLVLFAFALSNNIYLGNAKIITYSVPSIFEPLVEVFRVCGRFNWVLYYLIIFFIFVRLSECLQPRLLHFILPLLILIQIFDSSRITSIYALELKSDPTYLKSNGGLEKIKLRDPIWEEIASKYDKIRMYPIKNKPRNYIELAYFASENNMSTNFGYFSRVNHTTEDIINSKLLEELENNKLSKKSIYIIRDSTLWESLQKSQNKANFLGVLDGYRVLVPNFY